MDVDVNQGRGWMGVADFVVAVVVMVVVVVVVLCCAVLCGIRRLRAKRGMRH